MILLVSQGTVPLYTEQAVLLPNSHTVMLVLAASSGKVTITKPGTKKQYVFLRAKWSNKCGKRYQALARERNKFLRPPPPLWYWLPQKKLFPSQLLPMVTSDKAIARLRFLHTTFLLPGKAGGNLSVQQESITQPHCKHFLACWFLLPCCCSSRVLSHSAWVWKGRGV